MVITEHGHKAKTDDAKKSRELVKKLLKEKAIQGFLGLGKLTDMFSLTSSPTEGTERTSLGDTKKPGHARTR